MIQLTEEQRKELSRQTESPPVVLDPETNIAYVLVREDLFKKMQALTEEDAVRQMEPFLAELAPEDWEDPALYESKS